MTGRLQRAVALSFVVLLVASSASTGTVAAAPITISSGDDPLECTEMQRNALGQLELAWDLLTGSSNACFEITTGDHTETNWADLYTGMKTAQESEENTLSVMSNRLQDSESVAGSKAKIAVCHALKADKDRTVATNWAKENVTEYYSVIELNLVSEFNAQAEQIHYVAQAEQTEKDNAGAMEWIYYQDYTSGDTLALETTPKNGTYTLLNGTDVTYSIVHVNDITDIGITTGANFENGSYVNVTHPDGYETRLIDGEEYRGYVDQIETQRDRVHANLDTYVGSVYDYNDASDIDCADILDPMEIYQEASTNRSTTGYYGLAAVQIAAMGGSGDLNVSHTIEFDDGEQWDGTLFYTGGSDLDKLLTGTLYDPADYSGEFIMAVQWDNGTSSIETVSQPFTIISQTNTQTGESVNSTDLEKKVYDTSDPEAFSAEMEYLRLLRDILEREQGQANVGGAGGGDSGSNDVPITWVVGGVAVLAALALAGSGRNGGGRRRY